MSTFNRSMLGACISESAGILQIPTTRHNMIAPAHMYHPALQPKLSIKTPPSTRPTENPSDYPSPIQANPTLRLLPLGIALINIPTKVDKQRATAIPCMARNIINSIPVRASPHASMKQARRKHPVRKTGRLPTTSATAPTTRRHEPLVNLCTLVNASIRLVKGRLRETGAPIRRRTKA